MTQLNDALSGSGAPIGGSGTDFSFGQTPVPAAPQPPQATAPAARPASAPDRRIDPRTAAARPAAAYRPPAAAPPGLVTEAAPTAAADDDHPNPSNLDPELREIADLVARASAASEQRARQVAFDAVFNDDAAARAAVGQIKARLLLLRELRGRLAAGVGEVRVPGLAA